MYDDVLVPTDGSDGSSAALAHAIELAQLEDATLHVLYVANSNRESVTTIGNDVVDALVREGESVVEDAADSADEVGVPVVTEVRQGDPHETILEYAEGAGIDVIVMATRGRRGLRRTLLGSVTEKVVRTAPAPVLTVRIDEE